MTLSARSLTVDGVARRVLLVEPDGRPTGIVLSLHGSRSSPEEQVRLSGMDRLAVTEGAVVAFPQGGVPLGRGWAWGHEGDLGFLSLLTLTLTQTTYGGGSAPGEVALWTVRGGGHSWPGRSMGLIARLLLGSTTREIDATREIWAFHRRHA